jgi:hypothetical protein
LKNLAHRNVVIAAQAAIHLCIDVAREVAITFLSISRKLVWSVASKADGSTNVMDARLRRHDID